MTRYLCFTKHNQAVGVRTFPFFCVVLNIYQSILLTFLVMVNFYRDRKVIVSVKSVLKSWSWWSVMMQLALVFGKMSFTCISYFHVLYFCKKSHTLLFFVLAQQCVNRHCSAWWARSVVIYLYTAWSNIWYLYVISVYFICCRVLSIIYCMKILIFITKVTRSQISLHIDAVLVCGFYGFHFLLLLATELQQWCLYEVFLLSLHL